VINPTLTHHPQSSSTLALASFFSLAGFAALPSRSFSPSTLCLGSGISSSGTTRLGVSLLAPTTETESA
jgi:hypothetical protein